VTDEIPDTPEIPLPGDRWCFEHGGFPFEIVITALRLDGDVIHGRLLYGAGGHPGDTVIVPASSVRAGKRVE
jgi:hypothetical protein